MQQLSIRLFLANVLLLFIIMRYFPLEIDRCEVLSYCGNSTTHINQSMFSVMPHKLNTAFFLNIGPSNYEFLFHTVKSYSTEIELKKHFVNKTIYCFYSFPDVAQTLTANTEIYIMYICVFTLLYTAIISELKTLFAQ